MDTGTYVVVLITTSSEAEAHHISDALLTQRKAACVNIMPQVNSSFWWAGKLESTQECLLIVKTKASLIDGVIAVVQKNHSYTVPEVIALPILGGNPDYLEWIEKEVK